MSALVKLRCVRGTIHVGGLKSGWELVSEVQRAAGIRHGPLAANIIPHGEAGAAYRLGQEFPVDIAEAERLVRSGACEYVASK